MTSPLDRVAGSPLYVVATALGLLAVVGLGVVAVQELRSPGGELGDAGSAAIPVEAGVGAGGDATDDDVDGDEVADSGRSVFDASAGPGSATTDANQTGDDSGDDGGPAGTCGATVRRQETIRFAPGGVAATVEGAVVRGERDLYLLEVADDQVLTVTATALEDNVSISVVDPDDRTLAADASEVRGATVAGDYRICVGSSRGNATYSMTVSVVGGTTPPPVADWCGDDVDDRGEIRFAAGATSGLASDAVVRGERHRYRIGAGAGQTMTVVMTSLEDNAVFTLRSPSGVVLADGVAFHESPLPEDGDYELCIAGTSGNATYTVEIIIV